MANGVQWVDSGTGEARRLEESEIPDVLGRDDGWLWLDVPEPDDTVARLLTETLGIHPKAVADGLTRNHIARLHHYHDGLYLALHRPLPGEAGHVHYLELDLYIAPGYLVTVHGPRNPIVDVETLLVETDEVRQRLIAGRLRPRTPMALAYALVSALTNAEERIVNTFAQEVGLLEQRVMRQADEENPQDFLDELFTVRHTLLTVRTMAAQGAEVMGRAANLMTDLDADDQRRLRDIYDQYRRLDRVTGSQLEFLEGVTAFYRARTDTRMTIAAERLAVIAAVTLPVAAISGVMGMNVIVNASTHWTLLISLLVVMGCLSGWLLRWAHRQGWW
ncbi:putative metal ion transport protein [Nostocoides japonicum T1-X7]|uniref:Putative metal ion transport protein n=1 Tax=Nostocoides japonicum T1-X7 TaxID=1194083 RepID=A0A077LUT1_9MICO|nr:magnesium transporter CorA family protein [Tetrasphaera japonica]CCH76477.1 putative metal ion transport protein [Tetrasphaera japonica T1-X7]